jgi:hypothetical protein
MAGLVPAISLRLARSCIPGRDCRDIRAFTPVFAGYAGNDTEKPMQGHRKGRRESNRYTFSVAFFFSRSVANSTVP